MIELAPAFAERVRAGKRETRVFGIPTPNYFRKPYGPGWALVGDAGYIRDPITAQGIRDAFRDAEACALALDQSFVGASSYEYAMGNYQQARDASVMSMYEFTCQFATLQPPPPEIRQLFRAMRGNQQAMDGFAQMNAGTVSPAESWRGTTSVRSWPPRRRGTIDESIKDCGPHSRRHGRLELRAMAQDVLPEPFSRNQELHYASRQVTAIEINGTFYRLQSPAVFRSGATKRLMTLCSR